MTWHSFYCFSRCLGSGKRTISPIGSLSKGVFEPRTRAVPLQSVEPKLAEDWRERNGREGNRRGAWEAWEVVRGGKKEPASSPASPLILVFYFRSLRSISALAWQSWGTTSSLKPDRSEASFYFNVPSCDAPTFVLRLYFLLMNLLTNAKSPLLIELLRSKTPLFRTVYLWTNTTRTSGCEWISISRSS